MSDTKSNETTSDESDPADHVASENESDATSTKREAMEKNLKSTSTWLRLVFMIVFYLLACLASLVACFVVVLGFLWVLFTGETNEDLKRAGQGIATYIYQIIQYLTFNSDVRPFPFDSEWPSPDPDATTPDA